MSSYENVFGARRPGTVKTAWAGVEDHGCYQVVLDFGDQAFAPLCDRPFVRLLCKFLRIATIEVAVGLSLVRLYTFPGHDEFMTGLERPDGQRFLLSRIGRKKGPLVAGALLAERQERVRRDATILRARVVELDRLVDAMAETYVEHDLPEVVTWERD